MKRWKAILLISVMTMVSVTGCSKAEENEVAATPVETTIMKADSIRKDLTYAGKVQPKETVNVTSKLSGQVDKVYHDMGDVVQEGDILFTLDEKDLRDRIKQLEAQLNVSNASVTSAQTGLANVNGGQSETSRLQMKTGVENAKTAVDNARIAVDNAKIALDNAEVALDNSRVTLENSKASLDDVEKKYNDTKVLYEAGVATKNDFDSVELAYTQAQNGYTQAQNGYTQAQNTYESTKNGYATAQNAYETALTAQNQAKESLAIYDEKIMNENTENAQNGVNSAVAGRQSVEVQLQIARETLADATVKAPISGTITSKNISASNMISAASVPFTIVDMSSVTVDVNVSEKLINYITVGQEVDVTISTIGSEAIKGRIKNISPATDNTSTYPVKIEIENNEGRIKPGMFAEIRFKLEESNNAIIVPRNTVINKDGEYYVYVIENGLARKTDVTVGIDNGVDIEITSGLKEGDEVVTTGQTYVTDGEGVRIINSAAAEENVNADAEEESTAKEE
ncbi:MAG: efflux RND transporter periplasmic adaptor subunit [Firmicutes bacterium]|nr:efflux RND transporter periplasmic adaptor subunit [Bacillota bacterium]